MKSRKDTLAEPPSRAQAAAHDESGPDSEATHDGHEAAPSPGASDGAAGPEPSGSISELIRGLQAFVVTISRSVVGVVEIHSDRDLKVDGVEVLTEGDATIATVVPPTVVEEKPAEEAAAAATGEAAAEPEVIAKGKKEEGAEGEEK